MNINELVERFNKIIRSIRTYEKLTNLLFTEDEEEVGFWVPIPKAEFKSSLKDSLVQILGISSGEASAHIEKLKDLASIKEENWSLSGIVTPSQLTSFILLHKKEDTRNLYYAFVSYKEWVVNPHNWSYQALRADFVPFIPSIPPALFHVISYISKNFKTIESFGFQISYLSSIGALILNYETYVSGKNKKDKTKDLRFTDHFVIARTYEVE